MLVIVNVQHFLDVLKEVDRVDKLYDHKYQLLTRLNEILDYLNKYGGGADIKLELGFDWAPLAFGYTISRKDVHWMSGAVCLHCPPGFLDGTFKEEPTERIEWSMHS